MCPPPDGKRNSVDPQHPRPYMVSESKVVEWAKRELLQLGGRMKVELKDKAPSADAKVAQLEDRRLRVLQMSRMATSTGPRKPADWPPSTPKCRCWSRAGARLHHSGTAP